MNSIRLLAKLTAKSVVIGGAASGGTVEISKADVAAAISFAGVSVTADRLIRFLYCQDASQEPLLLAALVHELRKSVPVERPMLYRLVRLALLEITHRKLCRTCNGYGTVAAKACEVCGGSGLKAMAQRERAATLHVPDTTFRRNYEGHANTVYDYISGMANSALARLAEQFADRAA